MGRFTVVAIIWIKSINPANCHSPIPMVPKPRNNKRLACVFLDLEIKKNPKIHPKISKPDWVKPFNQPIGCNASGTILPSLIKNFYFDGVVL